VDPWLADDLRQVKDKTAQPLFEVAVRYAVTAPAGTPTDRVRGVADGVASAFGAHTGRNRLARHRLQSAVRGRGARRPAAAPRVPPVGAGAGRSGAPAV
jgi:hypothetical protein